MAADGVCRASVWRKRHILALLSVLVLCVLWVWRLDLGEEQLPGYRKVCDTLFAHDVNVTRPDFGGRRNAQALRLPFAEHSKVPLRQRTTYALDTDSLERCALSAAQVRRRNESCTGKDAFAVSVARMGFDPRDPTIFDVDVNVRLAALGAPLAGLWMRGTLVCANCAPQAQCNPRKPVQAFAMSYDHCNGTYTFRYEGLHGVTDALVWNMTIRFEYADFAHHMAYGRGCTRSIGSIVSGIPDGFEHACDMMFLWGDAPPVFSLTSLVGPRAPFPAPSAASLSGVRAAIDALPVCAGGQSFDGSRGRWLLRPRGPVDPQLCRAPSTAEQLRLWTADGDYVWCPYGCRLRMYAEEEIAQCFARRGIRRVLFAGDSRTNNLFFDFGTRLVHEARGKEPPSWFFPFTKTPHTHFSALGAHFQIRYMWGFFEQRPLYCMPKLCAYSRLNATWYFNLREDLESGLSSVRRVLAEDAWDVLVLSEGVHMMQPYFTIEDFEMVLRSTLNAVLNAPRPPRIVIYHSSPAFIEVALSGTRDLARQDVYNKLALRIVAEMLPDALVLDMFALTVARGRDRTWDYVHFYPNNVEYDPHGLPRTIGSEAATMILNMLCNEGA